MRSGVPWTWTRADEEQENWSDIADAEAGHYRYFCEDVDEVVERAPRCVILVAYPVFGASYSFRIPYMSYTNDMVCLESKDRLGVTRDAVDLLLRNARVTTLSLDYGQTTRCLPALSFAVPHNAFVKRLYIFNCDDAKKEDLDALTEAVTHSLSLTKVRFLNDNHSVDLHLDRLPRYARVTYALLAGDPRTPSSHIATVRRFIGRDGDHAAWTRVCRFFGR